MRKSIALLSILFLAIAFTLGCQTNPKFQDYNDKVDEEMGLAMKIPVYFWDRFLDLTDIGQLDLSFGGGALLNVHATKAFQIGAGYRDAVCFGYMPRSFGMWYEKRLEGGIGLAPVLFLYHKDYQRDALWGTTTLFDHNVTYEGSDYETNRITHLFDIGVSFHAFVGFDVNISPYQIFDFAFGFLGMPFLIPVDPVGFGTELDLANDDLRARKVRNQSDLPYYDYLIDPYPKASMKKCSCGSGDCSSCQEKK